MHSLSHSPSLLFPYYHSVAVKKILIILNHGFHVTVTVNVFLTLILIPSLPQRLLTTTKNKSHSDIDDGGEVQDNIQHNFELNGLPPPLHIPHTWGTGTHVRTSRGQNIDLGP